MSVLNKAHLTSKITEETGDVVQVSNESNTHKANNIDTDILIDKASEKGWVLPGGKVLISTTITNNMDVELSSIRMTDTITGDAEFVSGSLKIGEQSYPQADIISGFDLPVTLGALGADTTITYEIETNQYASSSNFVNQTMLTMDIEGKQMEKSSSPLSVNIINNEVYLLKTANTNVVKSGDEITYTITITNEGTFTNTDLFFTDPIPEGTEFVEGSVLIDNVSKADFDPVTGFDLGTLAPGDETVVVFKVVVK